MFQRKGGGGGGGGGVKGFLNSVKKNYKIGILDCPFWNYPDKSFLL